MEPNLTSILLSNNKMTSIPNGIFEGLTQLNQLHLSWNPNPSSQLSLQVSLQKVGTNQVKAVAPSGAPFTIEVPIITKNGTLAGGATVLSIPIGTVESQPITVTRTAGTTDAVTADIGTLPNLPSLHNGYALAKAAGLPSGSPPTSEFTTSIHGGCYHNPHRRGEHRFWYKHRESGCCNGCG